MSIYGGFDYGVEHRGVYGAIDYDRMRNIALKPADVVVYRDGDKAVAVNRHGEKIAESIDHAGVWRQAVETAPDHGVVAGLGEFLFKLQVGINKPLTIIGGKFVRDPSIGSSSHAFFVVGNGKGEPLLDGPVRFINCYFDGNERNISQKYSEPAGAPVHVGVSVLRARKVEFVGNVIKDMPREAIWLPTVSKTLEVIDHEEIIITNNWFENVAYGITAESYKKIIVANNIVKGLNAGTDTGGSYTYANYFFSLNYLDAEETIIENNIIDGEVPAGYPYAGTWGFTAVKSGAGLGNPMRMIRGNWVTHVKVGIYSAWKSLIEGNYIYDVNVGMDLHCSKESVIRGNIIRRFVDRGLALECGGGDYAEKNIVESNILDTEDKTANYGIKGWSYSRLNIYRGNNIRGTYSIAKQNIWGDKNICENCIYSSTALTNLSATLASFPDVSGNIYSMMYDGTYYYLVIIDLANKAVRKVQLS